jgi:hypothetical protein
MVSGAVTKKRNVYQRMLEAQKAFGYVQKDKPKGLQYSVVTHDAVTKKARAALMEAGLYAYSTVEEHGQESNRTWARVSMTIVNVDDPEDNFTTTMFGYGNDSQDKGPGKAISYAVKYCYLKAFGAETGDDADLEAVEFQKPQTKAEVSAEIGVVVDELGLDREYVRDKIERMYGPYKEIELEFLTGLPDTIRNDPDGWMPENIE